MGLMPPVQLFLGRTLSQNSLAKSKTCYPTCVASLRAKNNRLSYVTVPLAALGTASFGFVSDGTRNLAFRRAMATYKLGHRELKLVSKKRLLILSARKASNMILEKQLTIVNKIRFTCSCCHHKLAKLRQSIWSGPSTIIQGDKDAFAYSVYTWVSLKVVRCKVQFCCVAMRSDAENAMQAIEKKLIV